MTKLDLASELKTKQEQGLLKPSDFKKNRGWTRPKVVNPSTNSVNNNSESTDAKPDLSTSQSEETTKLKDQIDALELALFDKRLESLQEFSHYRSRLNQLKTQQIQLTLDDKTQLVCSLLILALFLNLLTK